MPWPAEAPRLFIEGTWFESTPGRGGIVMRPTMTERFWAKVDKSGECWLWTAFRHPDGYGLFGRAHKQQARAHRLSWELTNGPIADGLSVLHRCDVPACVNPAHLFLGTQADNNADMCLKGRDRHPAGAEHGRARFDWASVREIRRRLAAGASRPAIARERGVHINTIAAIATGRTWKESENA